MVNGELDWLENRARISPKKGAVIDEATNITWTYEELNTRANSLASWFLSRGIKKGDRIALLSPNHISYFDFLFACGKIGAIFVPVNWRLSVREIDQILADCSPVYMGVHNEFQHICQQLKNAPHSIVIGDSRYEEMVTSPRLFVKETLQETDSLVMI